MYEGDWKRAAEKFREILGQEGLDKLAEKLREDYDLTDQGSACPNCFEDRVDWLTWGNDGETVTCASCGAVYNPEYEGGFQ